MSDVFNCRADFKNYEVLANESGCEVEGPEAKNIEKLWCRAAAQADSPSQITICDCDGRHYVGYHVTLSKLTPWRVVRLGVFIGGWNGLVNAEVLFDGSEAYVTFFLPVLAIQNSRRYKKWLYNIDDAIAEVWR